LILLSYLRNPRGWKKKASSITNNILEKETKRKTKTKKKTPKQIFPLAYFTKPNQTKAGLQRKKITKNKSIVITHALVSFLIFFCHKNL